MFLHLSVNHSVHVHREVCVGQTPQVCMTPGLAMPIPQPCMPPPAKPTRYGQSAGGTHPTGMHSCYDYH